MICVCVCKFKLMKRMRDNRDEWIEGDVLDSFKFDATQEEINQDYDDLSKAGGTIVVKAKKVVTSIGTNID